MLNTIVAQATPVGKSGVSVIRMSGEKSLEIAKQIFSCANFSAGPNYMYLGKIDMAKTSQTLVFVFILKHPILIRVKML